MEQFLYSEKLDKKPKINVIFAYPAVESIAMASLGYLSIFKLIDLMDDVFVERVYSDTKTTRAHIKDVSVMGFSTSFEIDILTIIKMLEKYNIPLHYKDRDDSHPLIFAGGPAINSNPIPFAEFYDFISIGEGQLTKEVLQFVADNKDLSRDELLNHIKDFEGVWVPKFGKYDVNAIKDKLDEPVYTPILSPKSYFKDTFIIEIERGCPKMCNFCSASWMNLPTRYIDKEKVKEAIDLGLKYANKIAFLGAFVAGHPDFDEIIDYIKEKRKSQEIEISISSLRADLKDDKLFKALVECGQKTATIAIEAASQKMRDYIKKDLSEDEIIKTVDMAQKAGLKGLKIYTMIGFNQETQEDIQALVDLAKKLKEKHKGFDLTFSLSTLVPKPHTPFESIMREDSKSLEKKIEYLKKGLHKLGVNFRPSSVDWDSISSILSRADFSMFEYLIEVVKQGAKLGAFKNVYREFEKTHGFKKYEQAIKMPYDNTKEGTPWDFIKCAPKDLLDKRKQQIKDYS